MGLMYSSPHLLFSLMVVQPTPIMLLFPPLHDPMTVPPTRLMVRLMGTMFATWKKVSRRTAPASPLSLTLRVTPAVPTQQMATPPRVKHPPTSPGTKPMSLLFLKTAPRRNRLPRCRLWTMLHTPRHVRMRYVMKPGAPTRHAEWTGALLKCRRE